MLVEGETTEIRNVYDLFDAVDKTPVEIIELLELEDDFKDWFHAPAIEREPVPENATTKELARFLTRTIGQQQVVSQLVERLDTPYVVIHNQREESTWLCELTDERLTTTVSDK